MAREELRALVDSQLLTFPTSQFIDCAERSPALLRQVLDRVLVALHRSRDKAVEKKALADAKMNKEIGEAKKDAATEKVDADYKVAIEKCDALAGDAKASCVAAAKAKFGKN